MMKIDFEKISSLKLYFLTVLLTFFFLGIPSIFRPMHTPDEARYAEVSRETLENRHWLIPHINSVPHLSKPPLYYNIVAISFAIFGQNHFALRLVSILSFLISLLFSMKWVDEYGGRKASILTLIISLSMIQLAGGGQFGDLNMLFTSFLTIGLLLMFDALIDTTNTQKWFLAWIFLALGFLTKGPPAIMIFIGTLLVFRFVTRRPFKLRFSRWIFAILIYCVIAFPWYIWIIFQEGGKIFNFWYTNIFNRTTLLSSSKPLSLFLFYIPVFLIGSSGWGGLILYQGWRAIRDEYHKFKRFKFINACKEVISRLPLVEQYLLMWVFFTIFAFSIMRAYMISYIQPLFPPFAILLSLYIVRQGQNTNLKNLVRKITIFSFIFTYILIWGISFLFYFGMRNPVISNIFSRAIEPDVVAIEIAKRRNENFTLVQYDEFCPLFNFVSKRNSILVKESVHHDWASPSELSARKYEILRRIDNNEPLLILLNLKDLKKINPEQHKNLKIIFSGKEYILLSTLPFDRNNK